MLQADASWEITTDNNLSNTLAGHGGLRRYYLIEIAKNVPLYHLAIIFREKQESVQKLRLFRFNDLESAINSASDEPILFMRLTQETPFEFDKKSQLREIFSVFLALNEDGVEILAFDSDAGCFCVERGEPVERGSLIPTRQLWQNLHFDAYDEPSGS